MKRINVETVDGIREEIVYAPEDFQYSKYIYAKSSLKKEVRYYEIPVTFDIETTTVKDVETPYAYMYHWQLCFCGDVYFGRKWEQLQNFLDKISYYFQLNHKCRIVIWVHNLAYEFQFMRRFFYVTDGFFTDVRKPLKVLINDCFEFRDSYRFSNMSLIKFCQNTPNVKHYKLVDTYDYDKLRTPETPLTETEEAYCYNDVKGLSECIEYYMKDYKLSKMPLTSTGFVRSDYREAYKTNRKNREIFISSQLDEKLYNLNKRAFRGGDTHANLVYVNQVLRGVESYDMKSCYPGCMMMDLFPIGKFFKVSASTFYNRDMSEYAMLIHCRFRELRYIGLCGNPYIPISRCVAVTQNLKHTDKIRLVNDNGRIRYAELAEMVCTDIDLDIIKREYCYSDFYISEVYASKYGPLPDEFKNVMMDYFRKKTELDGIEEKKYEYIKSKNKLNSSYGMMVTDIAKPEIKYENGDYIQKSNDVQAALSKYYRSRNSFLSYQHGVWVTANARRRLRKGLWIVGKDNVYDDTDSIKFLGEHDTDFEKLNAENRKRAEAAGAYAEAPDGSIKILGEWESEGEYEEFKTLGAKKYIIKKDGKYYSTIAGVNKKAGAEFFNKRGIDAFKIGSVIEQSGHLVAFYNDDLEPHKITVNGCTFTTGSNIALINDTYTIGVTGEYLGLLEKALENKVDIF